MVCTAALQQWCVAAARCSAAVCVYKSPLVAGVSPAVTIRASNEPSDGPSFQALVSPAVTMQVPGCPLTLASLAAVLALAPAPATQARSSLASPREVDIMTLTPALDRSGGFAI